MQEFIKNITPIQWLGIIVLFNGTMIGGAAQLTDLVGPLATKSIVSFCSLGNLFLGGLITMFGGQGAQVKNVLAMPGVEKINVNAQANSTLAAIAVDPKQDKISPTMAAQTAVEATAKGS